MYLERGWDITTSGILELGLNVVWNRVWGVSTVSDLMSQYPAEELLTASPDTDVIDRNMIDILKCLFVC